MKLTKKVLLSLRSPLKCSFTKSKLRFFGLRKPKNSSFYSIHSNEGDFWVTLILFKYECFMFSLQAVI